MTPEQAKKAHDVGENYLRAMEEKQAAEAEGAANSDEKDIMPPEVQKEFLKRVPDGADELASAGRDRVEDDMINEKATQNREEAAAVEDKKKAEEEEKKKREYIEQKKKQIMESKAIDRLINIFNGAAEAGVEPDKLKEYAESVM